MIFFVVSLLVLLFVVPFVFGFIPRGDEYLMRPSMYLNLYLLKVCNLGQGVKEMLPIYFQVKK